MPKKTRRKPQKKIGLLAFLSLTISLVIFSFSFFQKTKPETPEHEMATIPPDIQKLIDKKENGQDTVLGVSSVRIPILIYHYVEYVKDKGDKIRQSLNIEPWAFEKQIVTLKDDGYTFMFPSQIPYILGGKELIPQKPIILTFDDGYGDFYTDVFPILKKYNVKAVAYIVPNFINNRNSMTMDQLKEISQSPLVEIGAHTMDHMWLRGVKKETVTYQVVQSKKWLDEKLGISVKSFAYPYGAFDEQTALIVHAAGFNNAVSTLPGIETNMGNMYFLYRLRPGYRTGEALLNYLKQDSFKAF